MTGETERKQKTPGSPPREPGKADRHVYSATAESIASAKFVISKNAQPAEAPQNGPGKAIEIRLCFATQSLHLPEKICLWGLTIPSCRSAVRSILRKSEHRSIRPAPIADTTSRQQSVGLSIPAESSARNASWYSRLPRTRYSDRNQDSGVIFLGVCSCRLSFSGAVHGSPVALVTPRRPQVYAHTRKVRCKRALTSKRKSQLCYWRSLRARAGFCSQVLLCIHQ